MHAYAHFEPVCSNSAYRFDSNITSTLPAMVCACQDTCIHMCTLIHARIISCKHAHIFRIFGVHVLSLLELHGHTCSLVSNSTDTRAHFLRACAAEVRDPRTHLFQGSDPQKHSNVLKNRHRPVAGTLSHLALSVCRLCISSTTKTSHENSLKYLSSV